MVRRYFGSVLLVTVLTVGGCAREETPPPVGEAAGEDEPAAPAYPLISADAGFEQVNTFIKDPTEGPLPDDTMLAAQIRRGFQIFENTPENAPQFVGNALSCGNCHLNGGQRDRALPLTGTAAIFPVSRRREARLFSLEDRIRGCFMRSMDGTQPPYDSPELLAVSAYIAWLSAGQPMGESPEWRGQNVIARENLVPIDELDPVEGERLYGQNCTACHGLDGQGVELPTATPGPLWGPESWNDGAGLARVYTLAGYIRYAMPLTSPGILSDEEAQSIAAYITAQDRPAFQAKANDFPDGAPIDAVYYPQYPENPMRAKLRAGGAEAGR